MRLQEYLNSSLWVNFTSYDVINESELFEAFNTKFNLQTGHDAGFHKWFNCDNHRYDFMAMINNNDASIMFMKDSDDKFTQTKSKNVPNKIYGGILQCIEELLRSYSNIENVDFNTCIPELIKFYDSSKLQQFLNTKFTMKFIGRKEFKMPNPNDTTKQVGAVIWRYNVSLNNKNKI